MQDPRGNLTLTYLGLADKLKPKWIVYENVPGLLSINGGKDFGAFLGALVELGYGFAYRVLDAQYVGGPRAVPQRRRRVFVVACLGDWRAAAEVLSLREGLRGYLETGNKKRKSATPDAGSGVEAGGLPRTVGTLCADTHPGAYSGQDAYTGRLIPAPTIGTLCARDYKGVGNQYVQEGKCIPCPAPQPFRKSKPVAYILDSFTSNSMLSNNPNSGCREVDVTKCLDTSCLNPACHQGGVMITQPAIPIHDQATRHAVVQPHIVQASELRLRGQITEQDTCPTLLANTKSGDNDPLAVQATPFRKSKRACSTTDNETWVPADASNTHNNFDLGDTRTTHAIVGPLACNTGPNGHDAGNFACNQAVDAGHVLPVVQPVAWTQNQREEVRLLGDKVGAIAALPETHQTNYIAEPVHQMPGSVAPTIGASGPPYSRTGNERVEAEALAVTYDMKQHHNPQPSQTVQLTTMNCSFVRGDTPLIQPAMAVRRLTPVECERLQGFPDNWSRISWKGKPEEQCPDGPRYKACGNSMAVPVMRWIGERIAAVDATL
jgi:site-specific DNA-cytosine methylase